MKKNFDEKKPNLNKKSSYIIALFMGIFLAISVFLLVQINQSLNKKLEPAPSANIQLISKKKNPKISNSQIDKMLKNANILYKYGDKTKALKLYKKIENYNGAISNYNLGVALMKEQKYKRALHYFKKALDFKEKITISAINAAVCSLKLGLKDDFKSYLKMAKKQLYKERNSSLYTYYAGLIEYYEANYFEASFLLSEANSKDYINKQDYLSSKLYSFLDEPYKAIDFLGQSEENYLSLGLLYAKVGEFDLAKRYLQKSIEYKSNLHKSYLALSLVQLKLGNIKRASLLLEKAYNLDKRQTSKTYLIKTTLNKTLFDINEAQKEFLSNKTFSIQKQYDLLFYFAPYKVFNLKKNINTVKKGGLNIYKDQTKAGFRELDLSSHFARLNHQLTHIIEKAMDKKILHVNKEFEKLLKKNPHLSILHYNLALSYAQLGDYPLAYKHFSKSYNLDNNNFFAGIFSLMCAKLSNKSYKKLLNQMQNDIEEFKNLEDKNLYLSLLDFIKEPEFDRNRKLEQYQSPFKIAFKLIKANLANNQEIYIKQAKKLYESFSKDLMANIVYFNAINLNSSIKQYAKNAQIGFFDNHLDKTALLNGSKFVRQEYVKLLYISGILNQEKRKLLAKPKPHGIGYLQTIAYMDLFTKDFAEAFEIYNTLIDKYSQQDEMSILNAAIASIGAGHTSNAVALLELCKLTNPNNFESRYALGLLYQQTKDFKAASNEYGYLGDEKFKSRYFDFELK